MFVIFRTLGVFLGLFFLILNVFACFKNLESGLLFYIIGSFVLPNVHLNNVIITYANFAFIPVFLIFLFSVVISKNKITITPVYVLFLTNFLLLILASFISVSLYSVKLSYGSLLGNFKLILMLPVFGFLMRNSKEEIKKIFVFVIGINILVALIQLAFPKSVPIFYSFYYKESLTPLSYFLSIGRFTRATGTFGSPISLGVFSLIAFSYFYSNLLKLETDRATVFGVLASLFSGILTLSKVFLIGVPIIMFIGIILRVIFFRKNKKLMPKSETSIVLLVIVVIIFIPIIFVVMAQKGFPVMYYLKYLVHPFQSFSTRYSGDTGDLISAIKIFKENFLIGVGATAPLNEFIGDSTYVLILHNTGLLGAFSFVILIFVLLLKSFRRLEALLMFISLILSGFAISAFFCMLGVLIISYIDSLPLPELVAHKSRYLGEINEK